MKMKIFIISLIVLTVSYITYGLVKLNKDLEKQRETFFGRTKPEFIQEVYAYARKNLIVDRYFDYIKNASTPEAANWLQAIADKKGITRGEVTDEMIMENAEYTAFVAEHPFERKLWNGSYEGWRWYSVAKLFESLGVNKSYAELKDMIQENDELRRTLLEIDLNKI